MKTLFSAWAVLATYLFTVSHADAQVQVFKQFPGQMVMIRYNAGPAGHAVPTTGIQLAPQVFVRVEAPVVYATEAVSSKESIGYRAPQAQVRKTPQRPHTSWRIQQYLFTQTGNERFANATLATRNTGTLVSRRLKEPSYYNVTLRR